MSEGMVVFNYTKRYDGAVTDVKWYGIPDSTKLPEDTPRWVPAPDDYRWTKAADLWEKLTSGLLWPTPEDAVNAFVWFVRGYKNADLDLNEPIPQEKKFQKSKRRARDQVPRRR